MLQRLQRALHSYCLLRVKLQLLGDNPLL